jgi:hypothetical protein
MILCINRPASLGGKLCNPVTVYPEPACDRTPTGSGHNLVVCA